MAGWQGFTDDDIKKMRQSSQSADDATPTVNSNKKLSATMQKQKKRTVGRSSLSDNIPESFPDRQTATIDQSMKLSQHERLNEVATTAAPSESDSHHKTRTVKETAQVTQSGGSAREKDDSVQPDGGNTEQDCSGLNHQQTQSNCIEIKELDERQALSAEFGNVQKFHQRQKVIEEANKHKRALLAKAIIDRQKKAKAEAAKLMTVQQELNHLDTLLTADVSIIRDKIEMASLEYMDAQKRYERAEKEFIAAKMDLFCKGDAKEHLTEHLYTIIHQNEVRKAKKLVELMEKLAMEVTPEEMELTIPAIPQLTNFTAVSTLHDPVIARNIAIAEKEAAEITSNECIKKPEAKNSLPNSPTTNTDRINHAVSAHTDIHNENISEVNRPHVKVDSSSPLQQTGILQSNQNIKETDLNQNIETLTTPAPVVQSDILQVSQGNHQSLVPDNSKTETSAAGSDIETLQESQVVGDSTQSRGEILLSTDKILSQSDSNELSEINIPLSKTTVSQSSSPNVSSGNGWTLKFS